MGAIDQKRREPNFELYLPVEAGLDTDSGTLIAAAAAVVAATAVIQRALAEQVIHMRLLARYLVETWFGRSAGTAKSVSREFPLS